MTASLKSLPVGAPLPVAARDGLTGGAYPSPLAGLFYTPSADFPAEAPRPGATTNGKNGTPGRGHFHGGLS